MQNGGTIGVLAQVSDHGQTTTARAGVAALGTSQPVPLDTRYRTGSVTKTRGHWHDLSTNRPGERRDGSLRDQRAAV